MQAKKNLGLKQLIKKVGGEKAMATPWRARTDSRLSIITTPIRPFPSSEMDVSSPLPGCQTA